MPRESKQFAEEIWYWYLVGDGGIPDRIKRRMAFEQALYGLLPGDPRCIQCHAPLGGAGAVILRPLGIRPSIYTPQLCNECEQNILKVEGGAEIELSLLFADIRGSTALSQASSPIEYTLFIQRFYKATSQVLIGRNGMVNRPVGDQVIGLFVPRFAGSAHARVAIDAALEILQITGHTDPHGPWAPTGVGVHTGVAYLGAVGSKDGVNEIAVVGKAANLAARLSSSAAEGEALISDGAAASAGLADEGLEKRSLELKGLHGPVHVRVLQVQREELNNGTAGQSV